jgi:hypothetical protein
MFSREVGTSRENISFFFLKKKKCSLAKFRLQGNDSLENDSASSASLLEIVIKPHEDMTSSDTPSRIIGAQLWSAVKFGDTDTVCVLLL